MGLDKEDLELRLNTARQSLADSQRDVEGLLQNLKRQTKTLPASRDPQRQAVEQMVLMVWLLNSIQKQQVLTNDLLFQILDLALRAMSAADEES